MVTDISLREWEKRGLSGNQLFPSVAIRWPCQLTSFLSPKKAKSEGKKINFQKI